MSDRVRRAPTLSWRGCCLLEKVGRRQGSPLCVRGEGEAVKAGEGVHRKCLFFFFNLLHQDSLLTLTPHLPHQPYRETTSGFATAP